MSLEPDSYSLHSHHAPVSQAVQAEYQSTYLPSLARYQNTRQKQARPFKYATVERGVDFSCQKQVDVQLQDFQGHNPNYF